VFDSSIAESGSCINGAAAEQATGEPPVANDASWPGRAKAKFMVAAVNQSSKADLPEKL
jgi:hypothetical protein